MTSEIRYFHESDIKVGVVVPVLNQFQMAVQALESIRTSYAWQPYIIDNWRDNKGVGKAWNQGIKAATESGCDYILVINDDVLIAPYSIDRLIQDWPEDYTLTGFVHHNDISRPPAETGYDESPDFGGFMITPETINRIGYFDENIFAWHEDNDYHRRIDLLGKKGGRNLAAPYHHFKSVTTDSVDPDEVRAKFEASRDYYIRKWGGYVGAETFKTPYNDPKLTPRDWTLR